MTSIPDLRPDTTWMKCPTPWRVAQAPRGGNFHIYDANGDLVPTEGTVHILNRICDAVNSQAALSGDDHGKD